jgi:hypothetical protein
MGNHLSVGFFSLSTFTSVLRDTKNIKKFYIVNFIKFSIFYALNIVVLKLLMTDVLLKIFNDLIIDIHVTDTRVNTFFEIFIEKLVNYVGRFLATYNIFLEKIVFGTMYIFLFNKPKYFEGKKMIYFRLLSLVPILYIIISLILRGLYNRIDEETKKRTLNINEYVLPILLGQKITIYVFFISTLFIIKYLSIKYDVFDEEGDIKPRVFTKIGSRVFGIMGIIELIIGLFLPSWSNYGIGGTYLLVLCTPMMVLYDYKKKYELHIRPCGKQNLGTCVNISTSVILYGTALILGFSLFIAFINIFKQYVKPLVEIVIKNFKSIIQIIDMIYTSSSS